MAKRTPIIDVFGYPTKHCPKCGNDEYLENFTKNSSTWNGYGSVCNSCRRAYGRGKRLDALMHYSGGDPKCACCGVAELEFLAIDHIHGGGNKERKAVANGCSTNFYNWLQKSGWPEGYQVLCHNCNLSRGVYGYCPCQLDKAEYFQLKDKYRLAVA